MARRSSRDTYRAITFWELADPGYAVQHCVWVDCDGVCHFDRPFRIETMWVWPVPWGAYLEPYPRLSDKYQAAIVALGIDAWWHMTEDSYSWVGPREGGL